MHREQINILITDFQTQLLSLEQKSMMFEYTSDLKKYFKHYLVTELEKDKIEIARLKEQFYYQSEHRNLCLCKQYFLLEKHDYILSIREIIDHHDFIKEIQNKIHSKTQALIHRLKTEVLQYFSKNEQRMNAVFTGYDLSSLLNEIGMSSNLKGRKYIEYIMIEMLSERMPSSSGITKVIYPSVATAFDTSECGVERSIRHVIETAWLRGNVDTLHELCGYTVSAFNDKPTNGAFISSLYQYLKLQENERGIDLNSFQLLKKTILK